MKFFSWNDLVHQNEDKDVRQYNTEEEEKEEDRLGFKYTNNTNNVRSANGTFSK